MEFWFILTHGAMGLAVYSVTTVAAWRSLEHASRILQKPHYCENWPLSSDPSAVALFPKLASVCQLPPLYLEKSDSPDEDHPAKQLLTAAFECAQGAACGI